MALNDYHRPRERIADWAYASIRDSILDGEFPPEARLSVPDLAKRLNVSRSPTREAILRLISEGLAEDIPHRGAFVAKITIDNLIDLYAVRRVLEGMAARLAASIIDHDGERDLKEAHEVHRSAVDGGSRLAITEADMAFHRVLYRMSGNPWLLDALIRLQSLVRLGMRTTLRASGSPAHALSEHEDILASVIASDPDNAEACARAHIDRAQSTLCSGFRTET